MTFGVKFLEDLIVVNFITLILFLDPSEREKDLGTLNICSCVPDIVCSNAKKKHHIIGELAEPRISDNVPGPFPHMRGGG